MSVGEAKATIRRGVRSAGEGRQIIASVAVQAAEAAQLARHTIQGSRRDEIQKGVECLRAAEHELELTIRRVDVSVRAANDYLSTLG